MSIILITHDIGLVASMADRVLVMYAGQIIEEAPAKEIFRAPRHPYTKALLATVPSIYDGDDRELVSIPGIVPEGYDDIPGCRFADRCVNTAGLSAISLRRIIPSRGKAQGEMCCYEGRGKVRMAQDKKKQGSPD